jgi:Flp pilus assembly protein TadG
MGKQGSRMQRGQAIVLIGLLLVVLFGFVGLALDGGRAYLDRRHLQASVDAASLAAAYDYMTSRDINHAENVGSSVFATNERLYVMPVCTFAANTLTCPFADATNQVLTLPTVDHSIAGVTFTATATHQIGITMMQVLGFSSTATIGATATALARSQGANGAAIQTLSPSCPGASASTTNSSLVFQGGSQTFVTGDVWSNGNVFDQSARAGGGITGNMVAVCGNPPFLVTPTPWTVSGVQASGWNMPDPDYPMPPINSTPRTWGSSPESSGTYSSDPNVNGRSTCYFLAGGVYDLTAGFTAQSGFISNQLRPPDEPNLAATTSPVTGSISSIPVTTLAVAVPANSTVIAAGQAFTVTSAGAAVGVNSIPILPATVTGTIGTGSTVVTVARAAHQFWDANGAGCGSSFTPSSPGSSGGGLTPGTYSVEVTAVRFEDTNGLVCVSVSPSCYERESPPSMCRTVAIGASGNLKIDVSPTDPGATDYNVYLVANATCTGLTFCRNAGGSGTISSCVGSTLAPPDWERPPLCVSTSGCLLPNSVPLAGTPPHGDLGNENHCVDPATGNNAPCPTGWTPGAVVLLMGGAASPCISLNGGEDIYIFSGYQYQRSVLYEPGPEQSSQPNTCANNKINGAGLTSLIGVIYMPAANVQINGNSQYQATIAGGVVAWTASMVGTGNVAIIADPTLRAWPSTVRLVQ